jgi:hypothetical protein
MSLGIVVEKISNSKLSYSEDIAVLIIAYRRKDSLSNILDLCKKNFVKRIYVSVDGPKYNSFDCLEDNRNIRLIVSNFKKNFQGEIFVMCRDTNMGCAASVLSACNWIFELEDLAIIVEDDCVPTQDFFNFSRLSLNVIKTNPNVWLSCGTQFAPKIIETDSWFLSKYPLTWGWATTKLKWNEIMNSINSGDNLTGKKFTLSEKTYWNAGARRARNGWVDVWDTILAQQLLIKNKYVLHPKECLVTNIGDDLYATNTIEKTKWIRYKTGIFSTPKKDPRLEPKVDQWLRDEFFRIKFRHIISTRITKLRDSFFSIFRPMDPLSKRLLKAETDRLQNFMSNY